MVNGRVELALLTSREVDYYSGRRIQIKPWLKFIKAFVSPGGIEKSSN